MLADIFESKDEEAKRAYIKVAGVSLSVVS
jgi:hypothetical protein